MVIRNHKTSGSTYTFIYLEHHHEALTSERTLTPVADIKEDLTERPQLKDRLTSIPTSMQLIR